MTMKHLLSMNVVLPLIADKPLTIFLNRLFASYFCPTVSIVSEINQHLYRLPRTEQRYHVMSFATSILDRRDSKFLH